MGTIKGLWKDPRSGIFYLRRKIPTDLRAAFNRGELYKLSLGTADPREAEKKFAIANGEYEAKVATFRAALASGSQGRLDPEEAKALVERHLTARSGTGFASGGMDVAFILRELDEMVADLAGERMPTAQTMPTRADWISYRKRIAGSDDNDEFSEETLARIEAEHEARYRPLGQAWFEFQQRMPRRRWRPLLSRPVAILKQKLELAEGTIPGIDEPLADALSTALMSPEIRQQLAQAPSARRKQGNGRAKPDMKLSALAMLWKEKRSPSPKAIVAVDKAVADFTSYIGDIGIGEITADDCFEYRDAVEKMPASMPKAHRLLPFIDQHMRYGNRTDLKRVKPASVKKYLGAIQALLGFAFQERFIPANVAAGIKVDGYSKTGDRRPFTTEELARLFAAPLFTQPWSIKHSRSSVSDATLRWLFLLALFSGGRIEELGQVLLADIKQANGIWYIDVDDYVGFEDADQSKRVKTASSIRLLPLHTKLIELGFGEHVEKLRKAGAVKLFPDLRADKLQVQTKEASRRAGRLIDQIVSKDPRLVFYSFRHTFKDLCRNADIPKDVHDQLTGHAPANVGDGYGLGRAVQSLYRHLKRLKLTFIDWNAIEAASKL